MTQPWYHWDDDDLILNLRIQPRASRDELCCVHGDSYRVRITALPIDGKANRHLAAYLAREFGVAKGAVSIEAGAASRVKRVRIHQPKRMAISEIQHPTS